MSAEQEFSSLLERHFSAVRPLSAMETTVLFRHYELLVRWNSVLNLTSIKELEEVVVRHYCESLFLATSLPAGAVSVLDVGSGAGFPGIPMAVARPDCSFVLAESHRRKAVFLREATRAYSNVRVAARRAVEVGGRFDWVVSRAVQWRQVLPVAKARLGLLLGSDDAAELLDAAGFRWAEPIPLPWGRRRVLLLGTRV